MEGLPVVLVCRTICAQIHPEPSSLVLLGSGLLGLMGFIYIKRHIIV
jgi:hypothetical protein